MKYKSALITQASGSIGGITFATGIGGMFIRARAIPVNPNTQEQNEVRSALGALTSFWNTLTTPQRNAWNAYAAQVPLPDTFGDPRLVSGFNHFIRSNTNRLRIGESSNIVSDAPTTFNLGATPILVSVESMIDGNGALGGTIEIDVIDAPTPEAVGDYIYTFVSPPFNANRTFHRGPFNWSTLDGVGAAAAQPITVDASSDYAWDVAGGQGVQYRVRVSRLDGRLSGELFIRDTTIPTP
jgi:hypothetical protein